MKKCQDRSRAWPKMRQNFRFNDRVKLQVRRLLRSPRCCDINYWISIRQILIHVPEHVQSKFKAMCIWDGRDRQDVKKENSRVRQNVKVALLLYAPKKYGLLHFRISFWMLIFVMGTTPTPKVKRKNVSIYWAMHYQSIQLEVVTAPDGKVKVSDVNVGKHALILHHGPSRFARNLYSILQFTCQVQLILDVVLFLSSCGLSSYVITRCY